MMIGRKIVQASPGKTTIVNASFEEWISLDSPIAKPAGWSVSTNQSNVYDVQYVFAYQDSTYATNGKYAYRFVIPASSVVYSGRIFIRQTIFLEPGKTEMLLDIPYINANGNEPYFSITCGNTRSSWIYWNTLQAGTYSLMLNDAEKAGGRFQVQIEVGSGSFTSGGEAVIDNLRFR